MEVGCLIFGMKYKNNAKDNNLQGLNNVVCCRDFKPLYILGDIWQQYIEHVMSKRFTGRSQSDVGNQNR